MIEIAVIVTLLASGLGLSTPLLFAALGEKIAERDKLGAPKARPAATA